MKLHEKLDKTLEDQALMQTQIENLQEQIFIVKSQTTRKVQRGVTGCTTSPFSISIGAVDPIKSTVRVSVKLSDGSTPLYSYTLNETELKININQEFSGTAYIDWEISE